MMKTVILSISLLLWILCLQQYCFLDAVNAGAGVKNYGENCSISQNCTSSQNLTCVKGICQCGHEFYFNQTEGCLPKKDLMKNCTDVDECLSSNSTCLNGTCDCMTGFYVNFTECLPQHKIFDYCNDTKECFGDNVECKENNCTCADQYYYDVFCYAKKGLFESCNDTEECLGDNAVCKLNNCTCEDQYYLKNGSCFEKHKIYEKCFESEECFGDNLECKNNECICEDQYYDNNTLCLKKHRIFDSCTDTKECLGDNVVCEQKNCSCQAKYYYNNDTCHRKKEIKGTCTSILECLDQHAICENGTCQCNPENYYEKAKACLAKKNIMGQCSNAEECLGANVICKDGICNCADHYYLFNGLCHERLQHGEKCDFDIMCQMLTKCKSNKCQCQEDYYFQKTTCFKKAKHGVVCEKNGCLGENIHCNYRCRCNDGYEFVDSYCQKKESKAMIIIVVLLILLLLGFLIYILRKIRQQKSADLKPVSKRNQMELDIPLCRPILMTKFPETVDLMHEDDNKIFNETFLDLVHASPKILKENADLSSSTRKYLPCHEATKPDNASKNRFLDILPFDHSRVKLKPVDDDAASDYINANYISGYSREKEYIAAQGPLPNTSSDFWRMVWEEKVSIIVMLTLCREKEINKCDNYWPLEKGNKLDYDDITVETSNVVHYDSYDYRSMLLSIDETTRTLKHFHFLQWADFSANVPVQILISFVQNVRSHITTNYPVVIHCSAGVGRTGTFIAVDYLLQFVDANPLDSSIDVFQFVSKMRSNRVHMVQNKNQYILINDCIKHAIKKKIALENGEPDNIEDSNLYENQGFVTINLTDKGQDEQNSQDLESVQIIIEEKDVDSDENPYENNIQETKDDSEENPYENNIQVTKDDVDPDENPYENNIEVTKDVDSDENPYENNIEVLANAEKDCLNDYDSDENPYDVPENVIAPADLEEENPYENQDFGFKYSRLKDDSNEKQTLTGV